MVGKRKVQRDLYDVGLLEDVRLDPKSFHGQLAGVATGLFSDAEFAKCYKAGGRPSVPPSQLALLLLLQHEAQVSDQEAVARSAYDVRWSAVLGTGVGRPLCAKSTLQLFRGHLILHEQVRTLFERSLKVARKAGLLASRPLRIAVDSKPILGRGAVEDTYNLLVTGMQRLLRALAQLAREPAEGWAQRHDLGRYFPGPHGSVKGAAELDWSDPDARQAFLAELVADARRLLRHAAGVLPRLGEPEAAALRDAAQLLEELLLQDVQETPDADGEPHATLRRGTTKDRKPSATDPEQRHGHKSKSKLFTGHKASVAVDLDSQLLVEVAVLPGNAPDAAQALAQVERVEATTGLPVASTTGDCAYGNGSTRQAFADAGRTLHAKVAREPWNGGRFPKSGFVIDLEQGTVTCPAGHVSQTYRITPEGGKVFRFGPICATCPLREHCTVGARGRTVHVHPQEALLRAARAFQQTPAGKAILRARVASEHRLARLAQLGIGQARYLGRLKTHFQLLLAATVANLRRTWNWQAG